MCFEFAISISTTKNEIILKEIFFRAPTLFNKLFILANLRMVKSGPTLLAPLIWPLGHVSAAIRKDENEKPEKVSSINTFFA